MNWNFSRRSLALWRLYCKPEGYRLVSMHSSTRPLVYVSFELRIYLTFSTCVVLLNMNKILHFYLPFEMQIRETRDYAPGEWYWSWGHVESQILFQLFINVFVDLFYTIAREGKHETQTIHAGISQHGYSLEINNSVTLS